MKLAYLIFGLISANFCLSAALASQPVLPLGPINDMIPDQVYFDVTDFEFPSWKDLNHKRFLNLYPTFRDGMANVTEEQAKLKILPNRDVIMMATQTRILIDRPTNQIEIDPENFEQILRMHEGFVELKKISPSELKTSTSPKRYGYRRREEGLGWCEKASSHCLQLKFIIDLAKMAGMTFRFCMEADADCSEMYKVMRENPVICGINPFECMEGVQAQGELTISRPEENSVEARDIRKLTGVGTPVHTLIQESFPWFNHVMEFSRVVIVLQPHPIYKNKTVLSTFAAFAISRKWWERTIVRVEMKNVFYGRTFTRSRTGLGQGIPGSIQDLTVTIAEELKR